MTSPDIRCTNCHAEFVDAELNVVACPACGSTSVPHPISQDVRLPINWHELRILTTWASRWADERCEFMSRQTLQSILRRLDAHRPEGGGALTLIGEVKEMQDKRPGAGLHDGESYIVPPREEQDEQRDK